MKALVLYMRFYGVPEGFKNDQIPPSIANAMIEMNRAVCIADWEKGNRNASARRRIRHWWKNLPQQQRIALEDVPQWLLEEKNQ